MAAPSVLAELGIAPEPLLAEFDLDPAAFTDPERRVPYRTVARLFRRCVEATSCDHFGLLVGSRAGLSSLGVVGYLASSAPTVGTALEIIRPGNSVADGGGIVTLDCREHTVSLGYEVVEPGIEHTEQLAAAAIAIGFNILRALCGPQWQPQDVQFSFAAPRDLAPFRKVFSLTPRFDQEHSAIVFPARWLGEECASLLVQDLLALALILAFADGARVIRLLQIDELLTRSGGGYLALHVGATAAAATKCTEHEHAGNKVRDRSC
jgi:Arabinose-binding domain of AraC transcription regulator, N-term